MDERKKGLLLVDVVPEMQRWLRVCGLAAIREKT
jgi:hypothetical protein